MSENSLLYHDLTRQEKDTVFGYFLTRLLKKENLWEVKPKEAYMYVAHLLLNLIAANAQELLKKYAVAYNTELALASDEACDLAQKYWLFKVNADNRLVTYGIFKFSPTSVIANQVQMGKTCYQMAARCNHQIYRKETILCRVFENLSECFEEYQKRLHRLRRAYLHFVKKLSHEEVSQLMTHLGRLALS